MPKNITNLKVLNGSVLFRYTNSDLSHSLDWIACVDGKMKHGMWELCDLSWETLKSTWNQIQQPAILICNIPLNYQASSEMVAILTDYDIWITLKFWADWILDYLKRTNCGFKREKCEMVLVRTLGQNKTHPWWPVAI